MRDVIAVLKYEIEGKTQITVMHENTVLMLENLVKRGAKYLFTLPKEEAPNKCPYCGSPIVNICEEDDPPSVTYECGLLVLRDYAQAEYVKCSNEWKEK